MATYNFIDPDISEDSDQESGKDSDDEVSQWITGTPQQKRHIRRRSIGLPSDSSGDEFEKEMMSELDNQIRTNFPLEHTATQSKTAIEEADNDALFYDPKMDDDDQDWVNKQREAYNAMSSASQSNHSTKLPKSDAVLNCPACMTAVCLDCQRHSAYDTQYRAMFTMNTAINHSETLRFKKKQEQNLKHKRKRKRYNSKAANTNDTIDESTPNDYNDMVTVNPDSSSKEGEDDLYHPVTCSNCNTRLAVYDSDEVYHFFNVISSYS